MTPQKYQPLEDRLVLEGKKVKFMAMARAGVGEGGVIIDYLRFTIRRQALIAAGLTAPGDLVFDPIMEETEMLKDLASVFAQQLGPRFSVGELRPGRDFYTHTVTILIDSEEFASVSGGGSRQRGSICFTLKGSGCALADLGWEKRVHAFFEDCNPSITRVDLAKDFFSGELTIQEVIEAHASGRFNSRGRPPAIDDMGTLKGHSRTIYIGSRASGKLVRFYEKGHQFKDLNDPWLRAEVELRSSQRVIPWDALTRPASYFSGAYAFCADLVDVEVSLSIPTRQKIEELSVARTARWFENTVAPALVHLTLASGSFDWLAQVAECNAHRPKPKSLRGLDLSEGVKKFVEDLSNRFPRSRMVPALA